MLAWLLAICFARTATCQPCTNYACDSIIVRVILDSANLKSVRVEDVTTKRSGRIVSFTLFQQGCLGPLSQNIGNLDSLTDLRMERCSLTTLPASIRYLKHLWNLDLMDNALTSLPNELAELGALQWLALDHNQLSALPDSIVRLHGLVGISVSFNKLCDVPLYIAAWLDAHTYGSGPLGWQSTQNCQVTILPPVSPAPISSYHSILPGILPAYDVQGRNLCLFPPRHGRMRYLAAIRCPTGYQAKKLLLQW
jgi:hypothetical protein